MLFIVRHRGRATSALVRARGVRRSAEKPASDEKQGQIRVSGEEEEREGGA
jgi:hypothetical protein